MRFFYSSINSRFTHLLFNELTKSLNFGTVLATLSISFSLWLMDGTYRPAQAETDVVVINLVNNGQVLHENLISQAETLTNNAIIQAFNQNASVSTVHVSVLGHRNGEIIPLLTTTVSRSEWQSVSRVSAWARYHLSLALFQRHDQDRLVALTPARRRRSSAIGLPDQSAAIDRDFDVGIDRDFDAGQLTGNEIQDVLSDID